VSCQESVGVKCNIHSRHKRNVHTQKGVCTLNKHPTQNVNFMCMCIVQEMCVYREGGLGVNV
jgi:hypothetical protein